MATVIIGGGIIGLSVAYYYATLRPKDCEDHLIHVIDNAPHLFMSASGLSGGFIAKDWFSPAAMPLGELSFRLHKELADEHEGSKHWGYASSVAYSLAIESMGVPDVKKVKSEDWLREGSRADAASKPGQKLQPSSNGSGNNEMLNADGSPARMTKQEGGSLSVISSEDGCAQIEPRELCVWLLKECQRHGVKIHLNCTVTKLEKDEDHNVIGVKVRKDFEIYEKKCKNIVIAAGAWTPRVFKTLFPGSKTHVPVEPLAGYGIVLRSPRYSHPIVNPEKHGQDTATGACHAIFCSKNPPKWNVSPEAISRVPPHGKPEIFVGGVNPTTLHLPDKAEGVKALMDKEHMKEMKTTALLMTGLSKEGDDIVEDDLEVVRESLCFRPVSETGVPVISKVKDLGQGVEMPDDGGVFIASGHGPWGISMSLGTGLTVTEMLLGKRTTANVSGLALD